MTQLERIVVRVAVFLSGAMLMAAEIAAFRIVGKTFGSALRETTAVIAVFLAAMSVGYWLGGIIGDRRPRSSTMAATLLFAALSLLVIPWLDALLSVRIAASGVDLSLHALVASAVFFSIPAALFAMVSPVAIRLFATTATESGTTAGGISALSTAGSILGSIATAFFLLDWLASINRTVIAVGLLAAATAASILIASAGRRTLYATSVAGVILLIATGVLLRSTSIDRSLMAPMPQWQILFSGDSAYHHIVVQEHNHSLRLLTFGRANSIESRMFVADPFGEGALYTNAAHIAPLMRPVHRVLVIGLGGGTVAKQMTHYYDDVAVDAVEVDPLVVDVAKRFFGVVESDRLRLHTVDGRVFLRRSSEKWDLIFIDAYTVNRYGDTIPPHLVTQEFFREAAAHLNEGGVLHFHCAVAEAKILPALQKTISSVFASTLTTSGEILASDVPLLTASSVLEERARASRVARLKPLFSFIAALHPVDTLPKDAVLLTDDYAPVDRLLREK